MFKHLLVLLLFVIFTISGAMAQTYGELAKESIVPLYQKVTGKLETIDKKTMPVEVKKVRKDIGKLKIFLDVFMYAYDKKGGDQLLKTRNLLDDGYEFIGRYKDLNDANFDGSSIDPEKLKQRRKVMLNWIKKFLKKSKKENTLDYLGTPLMTKVEKRKKKHLPKYFWSRVKFPSDKIEHGSDVLAHLLEGMATSARKEIKRALKIETLMKYADEEAFHDVRKLVRSTLKLTETFMDDLIIKDQVKLLTCLTQMEEMVDQFGDINDHLMAYHDAKDAHKKQKYETIIQAKWNEAKIWMERVDIRSILKDYIKQI
jgi:hypothetical protein